MSTAKPLTLLLIAAALLPGAAPASEPRLVMTDVLKLQAFGGASLSPDGKTLTFENHDAVAPVRQTVFFPSWRYDSRLFLATTDTGKLTEIRAPGGVASILYAPTKAAWPSVWSAKSDVLVIGVALSSGELRTALVKPANGQLTLLPGPTPFAAAEFDWLPDGRLVYVTSPGRMGVPTNEDIATKAANRWRATWRGEEPQVTVSSANPAVDASPIPPTGALMLARSDTGAAVKLASGDFLTPTVSPDGKRVAVICMPESMRSRAVSGMSFGLNMAGGELCVYRILGDRAELELRTRGFVVVPRRLTWSPDSRSLLVGARRETADLYDVGLWRYDSSSHALQLIPSPPGSSYRDTTLGAFGVEVLQYGWIGGKPAVVSSTASSRSTGPAGEQKLDYNERGGLRYDIWSLSADTATNLTRSFESATLDFTPTGAGNALLAADGRLWELTLDAPPKALTPASGPRINGLRGPVTKNSNGRPLLRLDVTDQGAVAGREAVFDLSSKVFLPPDAAGPDARTVATASNSTRRAVVIDSDHDATTLLVADGGVRTPIAANNQFLEDLELGTRETFQFSVGAQRRLGYLLKPPGYVSTRRYPAIMLVYGGSVFGHTPPPWTRADNRFVFGNGRFWASRGYVVICPSLPIGGNLESDQMSDITAGAVAALDELVGRGIVDGDRVGVMGTSFGGFSTLAILEHAPSRFKTGVVESAGPLDPIHFWGSPSSYDGIADQSNGDPTEEFDAESWVEGGQVQLKTPPWQNPAAYLRAGPLYHANDVHVPVMLIHGDLDGFDSFNDTQRMFAALVRTGTQPVFLHYWGEFHGITYPANQIDEAARISNWFSIHIGGDSHND